MKRILALVLLLALVFSLCACGVEAEKETQEDTVTSNKPEEYWQVKITQLLPLGAKGQVDALAICEKYVFAVGKENQRFSLVRIPYSESNGKVEFSSPQKMKTPDSGLKANAVDINANFEKLALLVETKVDGNDNFIYEVWLYNFDGTFEKCIPIEYMSEQYPFSVLVLSDNMFCITSDELLAVYNYNGELVRSISLPENSFLPAMLIGDMVVLQSISKDTSNITFGCLDLENGAIVPIDNEESYEINQSICKSMTVDAIINNGAKIMALDKNCVYKELFDWYDLTGDYGYNYSYVFQFNESSLLVLNSKTKEVEYINAKFARDDRECIVIAVYGHSQESVDQLARKLDKIKPEYRVRLLCYGNDDRGMTQMISDLSSDNPPDLIISEGYLINNALGFIDLFTLIDKDPELSRDDFLPVIINGLERGGKLPQIWTSFGLFSAISKGPLAYGPSTLKLAECQAFLDEQEYDGPLFDEYITRENLLSLLADNIIYSSWDKNNNSCNLNNQEIKELVDLCCERPAEVNFPSAEPLKESEVLTWRDINLEYLSYLESEKIAYRLFAGAGIAAYYNSCYMIPQKCQDVEKAWAFLRELLKPDYQLEMCADGFSGYPVNTKAFDELVNAFLSAKGRDNLVSAIEGAAFSGYEMVQMRNILVEKMKPYIYGNSEYETAISNAQSAINIFFSEHSD